MIEAIYPLALEQNMLPEQFWEHSVLEILDILEAHRRNEEKELIRWKAQIELQFTTAQAISSRIGYLFNDPKKRRADEVLMPWDVYPDLFEDKSGEIQARQNEVALQGYKAGLSAFAERWNGRIKNG